MRITGIKMDFNSDANCFNKFHTVFVSFDNDVVVQVQTCSCMKGCHNSVDMSKIKIGDSYKDLEEFYNRIKPVNTKPVIKTSKEFDEFCCITGKVLKIVLLGVEYFLI